MSCTLAVSIIAEHNNPQAGTLRGQLGNKVTTLATARIQASAPYKDMFRSKSDGHGAGRFFFFHKCMLNYFVFFDRSSMHDRISEDVAHKYQNAAINHKVRMICS